jgi:[NiFe] hydrogenase assembly HybE family chaperone
MDRGEQIAAFYQKVEQRMANMPELLNPSLHVDVMEGPCFTDDVHGPLQLYLVITPWFMNLMLLADDTVEQGAKTEQAWQALMGEKVTIDLPSGTYEWVIGGGEGLSTFVSCSLFSPMNAFESQQAAVAIGESIIEQIFVSSKAQPNAPIPPSEVNSPNGLTRRGFLRKALLAENLTRASS